MYDASLDFFLFARMGTLIVFSGWLGFAIGLSMIGLGVLNIKAPQKPGNYYSMVCFVEALHFVARRLRVNVWPNCAGAAWSKGDWRHAWASNESFLRFPGSFS